VALALQAPVVLFSHFSVAGCRSFRMRRLLAQVRHVLVDISVEFFSRLSSQASHALRDFVHSGRLRTFSRLFIHTFSWRSYVPAVFVCSCSLRVIYRLLSFLWPLPFSTFSQASVSLFPHFSVIPVVGERSELCQFFQGDLTEASLPASHGDTASTREPREIE
jgi:hypothetical protein